MRHTSPLPALLFAALVAALPAHAQRAEDSIRAVDSIKATVNRLFAGMKAADAGMVRSAFTDSAILQSVNSGKDVKTQVFTERVADFATIIGNLKAGEADERIRFDVIRVDGPLAIVWAPYSFYYKGQFHHCGADSFQLVLVDGSWKIQYLIDTRRKEPCQ